MTRPVELKPGDRVKSKTYDGVYEVVRGEDKNGVFIVKYGNGTKLAMRNQFRKLPDRKEG